MSQYPYPPPISPAPLGIAPHRGTLILVLGILGLVICGICGIFAWVLGKSDLAEMDAGRMDPAGRDLTNIGRILGIIVCCIQLAALALVVVVVVVWAIVIGIAVAAGP